MHIHIGLIEFLRVAMYLIVFGFFWHTASVALTNSSNPMLQNLGSAMAFIF